MRRAQPRRLGHRQGIAVACALALAGWMGIFGWPGAGIPGVVPEAAAGEPDTPCAAGVPAQSRPPAGMRVEPADRPSGRGIRVAVIDTGVADHPRLGRVEAVVDLVEAEDPHPLKDCDGHGTIVAGVIAARPDPGDEAAGIAPGAQILSIRQTSGHYRGTREEEGSGTLASLTQAIDAAIAARARVINISVVSCVDPAQARELDTGALATALDRAEAAGAVVVAAAGNTSQRCSPEAEVYPARFPTVLTVAALADSYHLAEYSLPAPEGYLSAPGTIPLGLDPWGRGLIAAVQDPSSTDPRPLAGTSFAAPVISGVAAVLLEKHPGDTPAQIRERIQQIAQPPNGVIDLEQALSHLRADAARPAVTVAASTIEAPHPRPDPAAGRARRLGGLLAVLGLAAIFLAGVARGQR